MWLDQILRAGAIIDPLDRAGLGINRVKESAHERPDTGAEIDRLVSQDRATTGGPGRNQTTVSDGVLCAGGSAETPLERSVRRRHTVQKAVVAAKVDPLIACHRWQPYWRFREDGPECSPVWMSRAMTWSRSLRLRNMRFPRTMGSRRRS